MHDCTSNSQPPYNHRTIYHAITAQYRTLNLSPKHKHRAISHAQCADKMQALCQASYAQSVAKVQAPRNIVRSICRQSASAVQALYAQCADKMQAPRNIARSMCRQNASTAQYRTLNLSPKHKHRANDTLFADFSAPFLAEFAFPSKFLLSA